MKTLKSDAQTANSSPYMHYAFHEKKRLDNVNNLWLITVLTSDQFPIKIQ